MFDILIWLLANQLISLGDLTKRYLIYVLKFTDGNKAHTAKILRVTDDTVRNMIKRYNINEKDYQ